jgi:capsid protein
MKTAFREVAILDQYGHPIRNEPADLQAQAAYYNRELQNLRRQILSKNINAKYDAAQTVMGNEKHWQNVDYFDPHNVATLAVRRKIRARSRYEVIENNPYLKGTVLSIANDFVGSGPKLCITDKRISPQRKRLIEKRVSTWLKVIQARRKIWRLRLAKLVDGESFAFAYTNPAQRHPIKLNFQVIECDRVSSEGMVNSLINKPPLEKNPKIHEIDGVRFDDFENPLQYHLLKVHPGGSPQWYPQSLKVGGTWINAAYVIHWFRQDRGWLRGISETVASLPLCAMLRRYTIAVVRAAEVSASLTGIIETEGPGGTQAFTDGQGNLVRDDPFDVFPIEYGMIMNLPWGYKLKPFDAKQPTTMYDSFVDSLLREICRPLLVPFNIAAGSSADSNMSSGVLDSHIYKSGQKQERLDCADYVLDKMFDLFWQEAVLVDNYLDDPTFAESDFLVANPSLMQEPPEHYWRWDRIGVDHTDPLKCAQALEILKTSGFSTDRDIQEEYYNRDVDDWRDEIEEDQEFRKKTNLLPKEQKPEPKPAPAAAKKPVKASFRVRESRKRRRMRVRA